MDGHTMRALEALEELVSAVGDARRRYWEGGDTKAIESSMLEATLEEAQKVIDFLRRQIALGS